MKSRTILAVVFACVLSFTLSGCRWFATETADLLSPPGLSGDASPIAQAITQSAGAEHTLKYPARGQYRSAVVQHDMTGDGEAEAFAFYAKTEDDEAVMFVDMIVKDGHQWQSASKQKLVAGGVDQIEFCDLDGDGREELLVGWQIYGTSEMQLAVYSLENGILIQRMLQQYTQFVCCDLDEDGRREVFLIQFNPAQQRNIASLYTLHENGVTESSSCELDKTVKTVGEPIVSTLSSGKTAIYVDEVKGVGAVTEVIWMKKGLMVNPLRGEETGETLSTLRSAAYTVRDINGDGVMEIPVQSEVPSIGRKNVNEKLYLTDWCSFNGQTLTVQMTAMMNTADGYYYVLSQRLPGQIAVLKDPDNRLREIYAFDPEKQLVGKKLLGFLAMSQADYEAGKYDQAKYEYITDDGVSVFLCEISGEMAADGVTVNDIRKNFYKWE